MSDISYRVMKEHEFEDAVFYRLSCECTEPEDALGIEIGWDDDWKAVNVHFFSHTCYDKRFWCDDSWWRGPFNRLEKIKHRIAAAIKILFTGFLKTDEEFIFIEEKHLDGFIAALEEGRNHIKKVH